jgi:hypothetical protein
MIQLALEGMGVEPLKAIYERLEPADPVVSVFL